jgi:UDP-N-acetylglucosamine:LPS N-acetylglucosamine transferase
MIEKEYDNVKVDIIDLFQELNPKSASAFSKMYNMVTKFSPLVYDMYYVIKKKQENNFIDKFMIDQNLDKAVDIIYQGDPDIIISTFPACSGYVSRIKEKLKFKTPLVTVMTDVVDSVEWIYDRTDEYWVPAKETKDFLISKAVEESMIRVTGIPVDEKFTIGKEINYRKKKQILIMGDIIEKFDLDSKKRLEKLDSLDNYLIKIVTGRNKKLYNKLIKNDFKNIEIIGFTNNISSLMAHSDLVVTKPGGLTLFEAINSEVPVITNFKSFGQENGNIDFIKKREIGILIEDKRDFLDEVKLCLENEDIIEKYRENIKIIKSEFESSPVSRLRGLVQ